MVTLRVIPSPMRLAAEKLQEVDFLGPEKLKTG
jgi:hypothetical protein